MENRPEETRSSLFALMFRRSDQKVYNPRMVNEVFETDHVEMFKIVPPTVGCIIKMECSMRIDAIEYHGKNGVITFWCSEMET